MKIAMWSGPRNLSTAIMYSFGNRHDCYVSDEPLYGAFLKLSGIDHPMRTQVLASMETDPDAVTRSLSGLPPEGRAHWYQKHMCHHMVDGIPLDWAETCVNVHLIRHPARVIASYLQKRENPTLRDIGFEDQSRIFEALPGPVIDSADIRNDPGSALSALCAELGIPFDEAMLAWPAGGHQSDGVWAAHWYNAVHQSTGFAGPEGPLPSIEHPLLAEALDHYEPLKSRKLKV